MRTNISSRWKWYLPTIICLILYTLISLFNWPNGSIFDSADLFTEPGLYAFRKLFGIANLSPGSDAYIYWDRLLCEFNSYMCVPTTFGKLIGFAPIVAFVIVANVLAVTIANRMSRKPKN